MSRYLALSIAYALLGALLLSLILHTRFSNNLKLGIILLVSIFYSVTYANLYDMRGWAVPQKPQAHFKLHWAIVEEPDKARGEDGAIFILGQKLSALGLLEEAPRLYKLPFDPELAQQIEEAKSEIEDGKPIEATLTIKAADPDEDELEKSDAPEGRSGDDRDADRLILNYRDIPRPDLPAKR